MLRKATECICPPKTGLKSGKGFWFPVKENGRITAAVFFRFVSVRLLARTRPFPARRALQLIPSRLA